MFKPVIFREYDIRGVYNSDFDDDFAYLLGKAYVAYQQKHLGIKKSVVSLGHDARLSSKPIVAALAKGMMESGADVFMLGLMTSPMVYFSTFIHPELTGAIQVTGSHNPPDFNGFKICMGTTTIYGEDIQKLREIIEAKEFVSGPMGKQAPMDIKPAYLDKHGKEFGKIKSIPVVLDCGNGAAGAIVRDLYKACGLAPLILFEEPDGRFPNHHPDPTVEKNMVALRKAVLENKAVCGIGFDGDADRIGVLDHTGKMVYGDELMVVISRAILAKSPGSKIIGDVKCSDRLYADVEKHKGKPIMWKTGHSLIKEKVKTEKAPFGGEMSGHVFFADRNFGYDDAPYAGLRLVEILSQTGKSIPELLAGLPTAFNTPEIRIDTTEEKKTLIVEKMRSAFPASRKNYSVNLIDGIRISFADGWALCRASNTQPVLVLRYESNTQAGLDRIRSQVEAVVNPLL